MPQRFGPKALSQKLNLARNQRSALIRLWGAGFGFSVMLAAVGGYLVGKGIALRENARDLQPWTVEKAANARADCTNQHRSAENQAALKRCLERIPFDGDWLKQNEVLPAKGAS